MPPLIQRLLIHNFGLKLFSLAFAVALWIAVARDPVSVVAVEVPVEFNDIPANLEISSENIPRLQIRLRGPEHLIRRLQPSDVYAQMNLEGQTPGNRNFDITSRLIHQPNGLEVTQIIPSQLRVSFDTRMTRQVDVEPRVTGSFAQGYRIGHITANPPKVTITGPSKHVQAISSAITEPIDVSGVLEHITAVRHAYVPDPLVEVSDPEPVRVTVYIEKDSGGTKE